MNRLSRLAALAAVVTSVAASVSWGQSISTVVSNNSGGGVFVDLTAGATPLIVTAFQTQISQSTADYTATIQIYTRSGTYVGNTASNVGWSLTQTIPVIGTGSTTNTATIYLPVQFQVPAGGTTGVYMQATSTNSFRITGRVRLFPRRRSATRT